MRVAGARKLRFVFHQSLIFILPVDNRREGSKLINNRIDITPKPATPFQKVFGSGIKLISETIRKPTVLGLVNR